MFRTVLLGWIAVGAVLYGQDRPVPAKEAAPRFTLPKGFRATLFAGEPDVVQPIAFTFDDRGRLWAVECLSYPKWKQDGTGADRVTMFEDTDGDGTFDVRQVVFEKGSNLSGIELGFGGIWLCSVPNLVFIPCDFNADRPTPIGQPKIILDGWNIKDTKHNIFNSLAWGPDGYLYGCNGIQSKSKVGPPGSADKDRTELNCGVWRYHPAYKQFDVVAHGTTNPFGLDFDEYGEVFITNCVIRHLFHFAVGGRYDRMYGQDLNPHAYQLMHSIADYLHWAGGDWTSSRGNKPEHSDAGGGHAHSGCSIYLGDNFPDEYRGRLFTCNIHGNRLNSDTLKPHGSGYKSERAPDFLFANDSWFRGLAVKYGPDGGLYVSDWTDTGECHNYDKADITNGRIYKVTYGKPNRWTGDLSKQSDAELAALHGHANHWQVRHARRILIERAMEHADGKSPGPALLWDRYQASTKADEKLQLALTLSACGRTDHAQSWLTCGHDRSAAAGIKAVGDQLARQWRRQPTADGAVGVLERTFGPLKLESAVERSAMAQMMTRLPLTARMTLLRKLASALRPADNDDANLPILTWLAVEPLIEGKPETARELIGIIPLALVRENIARKWVRILPDRTDFLFQIVRSTATDGPKADILAGILAALGDRRSAPMPQGWSAVSSEALASADPRVRERAMTLAAVYGDSDALATIRKTVLDQKAKTADRIGALRVLVRRQSPDVRDLLKDLLGDPAVRAEAIRGLAAFGDPSTPETLLSLYPKLNDAEKEDVIQTLASRITWASSLLDAVEQKRIARTDVSVFAARQMATLKSKPLQDRLAVVWGQLQPASARRAELTRKYKGILTDQALAKGDVVRGKAHYVKNCAACHKLHDQGGDIGPALTGAQRHNLDYVLENVLDPSAVVPREYQVHQFVLKSDRIVSGIIKSESDRAFTIRTANDTVLVPKDEIAERSTSKLSMMPEGIFDNLKPEEVIDLVAYLRAREGK